MLYTKLLNLTKATVDPTLILELTGIQGPSGGILQDTGPYKTTFNCVNIDTIAGPIHQAIDLVNGSLICTNNTARNTKVVSGRIKAILEVIQFLMVFRMLFTLTQITGIPGVVIF